MNLKKNIENYGRFKDAAWFDGISKSRMMIFGQGGIGSWLSFFLARTGADVILVDMDTVELSNLAGQLYSESEVGKAKVKAMGEILKRFVPRSNVTPVLEEVKPTEGQWLDYLPHCDVVCVSFDNIKARQIVYGQWCDTGKEKSLFVDGRMSIEQGQIFTVNKGNEVEMKAYEATFFDDSELPEASCTFKATSHCGALIASLMTAQVANWFTNSNTKAMPRVVSKQTDFYLPINKFDVV